MKHFNGYSGNKCLITLVFGILAFACNQPNSLSGDIYAPDKKAINGYDPVAFFTQSGPIKGNDEFTYSWKDVNWYFASQQDLDAFKANPEMYAPQYGGYCAYGTAEGHKAPTQPDTWTIANGKLYFNYNQAVKQLWSGNRDAFIQKADTAWLRVKQQ
jgi:YHS domain-containing protein